jgi:MFS family permease
MSTLAVLQRTTRTMTAEERKVIIASSLGTVFEWYDFYLYGSLAAVISRLFFSGLNVTASFIFALLAFAAGFAIRPVGALFFGRLGDIVGRKYTFLVTITLMGLSTFLVGILPTYATAGFVAPIALLTLRLLQGLALGGEYGGAATYVAEHAPPDQRGSYTSWIQTTATLGFLLSLVVVLGTRLSFGEDAFANWGWRVPFLVSILLLGISIWIRLSLQESPMFQKIKSEGRISQAPISEAFGQWKNVRIVLICLFGLVAGQAVVWYTGQFYILFFLTQTLKVDAITANLLVAVALIITAPLVVVFGKMSDAIGRKPIMLAGFLIAAIAYQPLFHALTRYVNPALDAAQTNAPVTVIADPAACAFQFNPVGTAQFTESCDIAKSFLAREGIGYRNEGATAGTIAAVQVGDRLITAYEAKGLSSADLNRQAAAFGKALEDSLRAAGYPKAAKPEQINYAMVILILTVLVAFVGMVYGPIAATLVELFPTRIRYTAMSLPYHIGNGWFGGFLPATAFALVAASGNIYAGLRYPIAIAAMSFIVGLLFLPETKDRSLDG